MSEARVQVDFFDTTLRDGAQALPDANQFPPDSKPKIAEHIAQLGVGVIEAGFARTAEDGLEILDVAKSVGQTNYAVASWRNGEANGEASQVPVITSLSRTTNEDIDASWEAVHNAERPRIHTFVSTNYEHIASKFAGKTPEDVLMMGKHAVRYAKMLAQSHPGASVEFSAEAASTTDPIYLERIVKTMTDEGADVINVPDTVGERTPSWMTKFYGTIIEWVHTINPDTVISAHNHNDLDMAAANSFSLVEAAASFAILQNKKVRVQIETAICGLGERAGNTDIVPVVANLFKQSPDIEVPIEWQFNPDMSVSAANSVLSFAGLAVDRQSPIVGRDTNVHRSGIHSDGVIKGGHRIYTPHDPTFWGHENDARHEDGKYQGRRGRLAITTQSTVTTLDRALQTNPKFLRHAQSKEERDEIIQNTTYIATKSETLNQD